MPRLREKKRLREQRILGIKTGIPTYVPPELVVRGFKLKFYDISDVKIGELGSDIKTGKVIDVSFELRTLGCGAFSFILDDEPGFTIGFRTRVDIHPYFDPTPWFTGFIQTIPQTGQKRPFEYTGFGFFDQLDWVTVTGSYTSDELADIVKDIIENIVAPDTQIIYNVAKIEATGYTVNSIDFDHVSAKDVIQTLADMAQDYEFGVDDSRQFYFRPVDTDISYSYWVGKHFQNIEIEEDPFTVRNKLYIKIGEIQAGGTNIIGSVQSNDSINAYGLREEVITVPESLNTADATRWANLILSELENPAVKAKISNILFDETKAKITAQGKARVTVEGGTEYSLFIRAVLYSITAGGILGSMELGSI